MSNIEFIEDENPIDVYNKDGLEYMSTLEDNSVDLILTDPPYIVSKESGMNTHYNKVKELRKNAKTPKEWKTFRKKLQKNPKFNKITKKHHTNYIKYGTIYGKKFCVQTDYGDWDKNFTLETLEEFIKVFYNKLKKGGTCIIFFDLWKITPLKELLEKYKFKQLRFIEWIKTNPQPRNSKVNYLTNCREIALLAIKGTKPTFNSKYDKGIYEYPLQGGKDRFHPTQKNLELFEKLIQKHSNEGDLVIDPFLGSGTTALACKNTSRSFGGSEVNEEYFKKLVKRLE